MKGYHDELKGKTSIEPDDELTIKAYDLGVSHAISTDIKKKPGAQLLKASSEKTKHPQ